MKRESDLPKKAKKAAVIIIAAAGIYFLDIVIGTNLRCNKVREYAAITPVVEEYSNTKYLKWRIKRYLDDGGLTKMFYDDEPIKSELEALCRDKIKEYDVKLERLAETPEIRRYKQLGQKYDKIVFNPLWMFSKE